MVDLESEYAGICDIINLADRPTIKWDNALTSARLNGVYLPGAKEIRIAPALAEWPDELKRTIAHELAHHIMCENGYRRPAHGWPFLTLELVLATWIGYDGDLVALYVLNRNTLNWEPTAGVRRWWRHAQKAIDVLQDGIHAEQWGNRSPDAAATFILGHCSMPPFLRKVAFWRHSHYTDTQGLPRFLREISVPMWGIVILSLVVPALHFILNATVLAASVLLMLGTVLSAARQNEFSSSFILVAALKKIAAKMFARVNIFARC